LHRPTGEFIEEEVMNARLERIAPALTAPRGRTRHKKGHRNIPRWPSFAFVGNTRFTLRRPNTKCSAPDRRKRLFHLAVEGLSPWFAVRQFHRGAASIFNPERVKENSPGASPTKRASLNRSPPRKTGDGRK